MSIPEENTKSEYINNYLNTPIRTLPLEDRQFLNSIWSSTIKKLSEKMTDVFEENFSLSLKDIEIYNKKIHQAFQANNPIYEEIITITIGFHNEEERFYANISNTSTNNIFNNDIIGSFVVINKVNEDSSISFVGNFILKQDPLDVNITNKLIQSQLVVFNDNLNSEI